MWACERDARHSARGGTETDGLFYAHLHVCWAEPECLEHQRKEKICLFVLFNGFFNEVY